jgi:hypothetical protein
MIVVGLGLKVMIGIDGIGFRGLLAIISLNACYTASGFH